MMKNTAFHIISLIIVALALFLLFGCVSEEVAVDMDPPNQVVLTPRIADTVYIEQGIDAVPDGDYIYLSWEPNLANDLEGYRVYRKANVTEGSSQRILIADLDRNTTEYEDRDSELAPDASTGLSTGFSYWVTAYDESGNESRLSDEAYFKLMVKPTLVEPFLLLDGLHLTWTYEQINEVDFFTVRLFHQVDGVWLPFWMTTYELFSPLEVVYPNLIDDGTYIYQVDVVGATAAEEPSGSEKNYQFSIP